MKIPFVTFIRFFISVCTLLIVPLMAISQSIIKYRHWANTPHTAHVIKEFGGGTRIQFQFFRLPTVIQEPAKELPAIQFVHYNQQGTQVDISGVIDYVSDAPAEIECFIRYEVVGDVVKFVFWHAPRKHPTLAVTSDHMKIITCDGLKFKIEIPDISLESLKNRNELIPLNFTYIGRGEPCPGIPRGPQQGPRPEDDKTICPGDPIPPNWAIVHRQTCVSCPGSISTCKESKIIDLRYRTRGFRVNVCPTIGWRIPPDYEKVGTLPCIGSCGDPGSGCNMTVIVKK